MCTEAQSWTCITNAASSLHAGAEVAPILLLSVTMCSTVCSPCRCRGRPLPPGALSTDMRRLASAVSWLHCCAAALSRPPGKPPAQAYTYQASKQGICPEELAACKSTNFWVTALHVEDEKMMSAGVVVSGSGRLRTLEGEAEVCTLRLGISREAIAPSCIQRIALHNVALRLYIRQQARQHAAHILPPLSFFEPGLVAHGLTLVRHAEEVPRTQGVEHE